MNNLLSSMIFFTVIIVSAYVIYSFFLKKTIAAETISEKNKIITETIIKPLAAHPYLFAFGLCLLLYIYSFGFVLYIKKLSSFILSLLAVFISNYCVHTVYNIHEKNKSNKVIHISFEVISIAFLIISYHYVDFKADFATWFFLEICYILISLFICCDKEKYRQQLISLMIIGSGFALKISYVLNTSIYSRQHDVGTYDGKYGHIGYIRYLMENHHLADFDVRQVWQFYHPPLHHTISAVWISITQKIFGLDSDRALESLQILTLFYSFAIIITAYKILRYFKLNGFALYIPLMIISFHPAFVILSGSINNDVLSVAFIMGAVLCTLNWYKNPTLKNIMKISLCVGLGMMTKLSAALVAPAIAVVFLVVFIKKFKTDGKKLFGQFCAFGAFCIPAGLWYQIRNYIKWKIPVMYVQEIDKNVFQYIGDIPFLSRITNFSSEYLSSPFIQWKYQDSAGNIMGNNEINPLIALFKSSLFDEISYSEPSKVIISKIIFWLGILIALFAFVSMIIVCIRKGKMLPLEKVFFVAFYATMMINFYKMSCDYPFVCTMSFRYITPTVVVACLFMGIFIQNLKEKNSGSYKVISKVSTVCSVAFCILSFLIFMV